MKDKVENLILKNRGEIITLDYYAPKEMPICEFIYDGISFSISETEDDNWECHYAPLTSTDLEIDTLNWKWELADVVKFYIDWVNTFRNEKYYREGIDYNV